LPKRDHYSQFQKSQKHRTLYLPVWEFEELSTHLLPLYTEFTAPTFQHRFSILGGIPRLIFENDNDPKKIIDDAFSRTKLDTCLKAVGEIYAGNEVSHNIFHLKPTDDFKDFQVCYASDYVAEMVALRFIREKQQDLVTFIQASDGSSNFGVLRGHLFEGYCHNVLPKGGKFKIRSLEDSTKKIEELDIKKCEKVIFDGTLKADAQKENIYYCPLCRNFGAVDSWIKNIGFFQITINLQHDIKMAEMVDCFSYSKSRLYFVVPSSLFESFKKQNFVTKTGGKAKNFSPDLNKLEQYVLSVDLSLSTEKRKAGSDLNTNSVKKVKS